MQNVPVTHESGSQDPKVYVRGHYAWLALALTYFYDVVLSSHLDPVAAEVDIEIRNFAELATGKVKATIYRCV